MELLQSATEPNSSDAEAQQLLCRLALQIERWDDAIRACEKAVAGQRQQ